MASGVVASTKCSSAPAFKFDASTAQPTAAPTVREVQALRELDPDGQFERDARVQLR